MIVESLIAVDSSSIIAFLQGDDGGDTEIVARALKDETIIIPPPVLVETLSNAVTRKHAEIFLLQLQILEIKPGFWQRAAELRAMVLSHGFKARFADTLIAQCCIDHHVPLLTRDKDFRHYASYGGLKLIGATNH